MGVIIKPRMGNCTMGSSTQSAIIWPSAFLPGTTDNFVSNEVIAPSLTPTQIWSLLSDISKWNSYYNNVSSLSPPSSGPHLKKGDTFKFSTFGFPVLTCTGEESVSVYHAWLVEDLEGGRVRILTQESQSGKPAKELAGVKPNKMLLGHQDWCEGLVRAARGEELGVGEKTNLKAAELGSYGEDL